MNVQSYTLAISYVWNVWQSQDAAYSMNTSRGIRYTASMHPRLYQCIRTSAELPGRLHLTPASSVCLQLSIVRWGHWMRILSDPPQPTLSICMGPVPWPKCALENAWASVIIIVHTLSKLIITKKPAVYWPAVPYPSCLQTTLASAVDQESSHTVPHTLFRQISTLPSSWFWPPTSLRSPSRHVLLLATMHMI